MKRVAVVGFGFMGLTHALNILKNKNMKLVAIVDKDTELIERTLSAKGGNISTGNIDQKAIREVKKYTDLDLCLNSEELDAVSICVPTFLHYEMAKRSLLYNKHVFVEKPLCLDMLQAEDLISLSEEKNKVLMTGHVVRFMPPYQKLKHWVESKEYGNLKFLSLHRFSGRPGWGQWLDKAVVDSSGGALFDLVIHDIDFANYLLGAPDNIESRILAGSLSQHDYISAMWEYRDNHVRVSIEGGNRFHINHPFQAGYMAQFEDASILYNSLRGDVIHISDDKSIKEISAGDPVAGYYAELAYFADCIEYDSKPLECMPHSSLQSIKLCYKHIKN